MIRWKWNYALLALFTLLLEIAIEHFFKGGFIRYFMGDFFIVWLLFYSLRTIINLDPRKIIFAVILFSFTIEFLQLAQFPARMGWESRLSDIVLGSSFDPLDLVAYLLGGVCAYLMDLGLNRDHRCIDATVRLAKYKKYLQNRTPITQISSTCSISL